MFVFEVGQPFCNLSRSRHQDPRLMSRHFRSGWHLVLEVHPQQTFQVSESASKRFHMLEQVSKTPRILPSPTSPNKKKPPQPPSEMVEFFVFGDKCHLQRFQAVAHSNSPLTYEVRRVWRAGNALHQAHVIDEPGRRAGPIWLQHRKPTRTALAPGASGRWHFGGTATAYLLPTSHLPTHSPHHAAYCVR